MHPKSFIWYDEMAAMNPVSFRCVFMKHSLKGMSGFRLIGDARDKRFNAFIYEITTKHAGTVLRECERVPQTNVYYVRAYDIAHTMDPHIAIVVWFRKHKIEEIRTAIAVLAMMGLDEVADGAGRSSGCTFVQRKMSDNLRIVYTGARLQQVHRIKKKAKEFEEKIMRQDRLVNAPPKIHRCWRLHFLPKTDISEWFCLPPAKDSARFYIKTNKKSVWIERGWVVRYGSEHAQHIWGRLEYAQAERNALNCHYARWLMGDGTKAEGL